MTTAAAAESYLKEHQKTWHGTPYAVFNPHDRPHNHLPVIYGFNNGGAHQWYQGVLLAEDGTALGSHICSHEGYMLSDLGILEGSRPDRHEVFQKHYPDGYRMDFIPYAEVGAHSGLKAAIEKNEERGAAAKATSENQG